MKQTNKQIIRRTLTLGGLLPLLLPIRARIHAHVRNAHVRGNSNGARAWTRVVLTVALLVTGVIVLSTATASAAIQGYVTQDGQPIPKGMAVGLATEQPTTQANNSKPGVVQKSSMSQAEQTIGVVVEMSSGPLTVSDTGSTVYVANTGVAMVFTTDLNGVVHEGDLLAPSPIKGVLMRATEGTKGVLGIALDNFPQEGAETVKLDNNGAKTEAKVAPIAINMDVKFVTATSGNGKSLLQRLGEAVVGREVSAVQVFVALMIIVLVVLVVGGIIYATVSSTIISLGRNPYARKTILRALFQIIVLVVVVLVLGMAVVYLVLWL